MNLRFMWTGGNTGFLFQLSEFQKKKNSKFWLISLLVIFLLIFTHVFDSVYKLLPAVNTSSKFRIITLFNFAGAVLLGLNLQDLVKNREYYLRHKIRYFSACCWAEGLYATAIFGRT